MSSQRVATHSGGVAHRRPRPTLLVLEDDALTRDLLVELGEEAGWDVRPATSVPSMRRALESQPPDLLIIDEDVADGYGGDLAREVRETRPAGELPIIIFSAAPARRRAELATLGSVLGKPFDLEDLERRLARADGDDGTGQRRHQRAS